VSRAGNWPQDGGDLARFEQLNAAAAALLDPFLDPDPEAGARAQSRRLAEALTACAQAADRAGARGLNHLATLAVPHLPGLVAREDWPAIRDALEHWIGALVAYCAGHIAPHEADALVGELVRLPGMPPVPAQFVTLIGRRLADDARRIAQLAGAGAPCAALEPPPQAQSPTRPAPAGPAQDIEVARDELDMLAQAIRALGDESAALLATMPMPGSPVAGAMPDGHDEWLELLGERLGHWSNAAGYLGLVPLVELVGCVSESLALWHRGAPDGGAARERLRWFPAALADFLLEPGDARARPLCEGLADSCWPVRLAPEGVDDACAAITRLRLVGSRQVQPREAPVGADDLSLVTPVDADPGVLEQLLRELPALSVALGQAIDDARRGRADALDDARRAAHTLKGSANTVGIRGIATLAHQLEDLLELAGREGRAPDEALQALLEEATDCLAEMCEAVAGLGQAPVGALALCGRLADAVRSRAAQAQAQGPDPVHGEATLAVGSSAAHEPLAPSEPSAAHEPLAPSEPSAAHEPLAPSEPSVALEPRDGSLRVVAGDIDRMLDLSAEAAILLAQVQEQLARLQETRASLRAESERLQELAGELDRVVDLRSDSVDRGATQPGFDPLELDRYDDLHTVSRRIAEAGADSRLIDRQLDRHVAGLGEAIGRLDRVQEDLRETAMRARMVPVATVVPRLQRALRQAARMAGRRVHLEIAGDGTAVDARLLHALLDPLVHLLRNAVDHGIEDEAQRIAAGKPASGSVRLSFEQNGREFLVGCQDDGRGLDESAVRARAVALGLLAADAPPVGPALLSRLVLTPGFSTRGRATQLSGRGLGMDIVHKTVAALRGSMTLRSAPGRGLGIELAVPISLAGVPVLVARAPTHVLALSVRQIDQVLPAGSAPAPDTGAAEFVAPSGARLPLHRLDALLGLPPGWFHRVGPDGLELDDTHAPRPLEIVLIVRGADGEPVAIVAPELSPTRRVVLRPLPGWLPARPGIEGACVLGDGTAAAVIDLPALLAAGGGARAGDGGVPARAPAAGLPRCLVVDDSVSVRRATEAFMRDLGFDAEGAGDGLEALARMRRRVPELALVDLEMPRMNGVELVRAMRADPALRAVPVIMITSRASEKHRRLALGAGVDVFLTKPYTDDELATEVRVCLEGRARVG
jgi:chemotaxis protein histidine kinase CheA